MAENSMSKVTITLGHSRQVVTKGSDSSFGDSESTVGRKRSVRDRLGGYNDPTAGYDNKRLRAGGSSLSPSSSNGVDDTGISQNDLRFKIMQKTMLKKSQSSSQQSGLDLRDMLSRPAQSSTSTVEARQHMPERKDVRQHFVEPRDGRHFVEPRDGRQRMSELRDLIHVAEVRDGRRHMAEVRDSRKHMPEGKDARQYYVKPRDGREHMSELRDPRLLVAEVSDGRRHMGEVRDGRHHMPEGKDVRQHFLKSRDGSQSMSELRAPRLHVAEVRDGRRLMAEVRDSRQHMPEGKDARQHFPEPRDGGQFMSGLSDSRLQMAEVRNGGQHMAEVMDGRQHTLERKDVRHHMPEPSSMSTMGRMSSTSIAGSLTHMDPLRSSYSQWTLDRLRRGSPDGVMITSRGLSPSRREEELRRRASVRLYDDVRVGSYTTTKDVEFSRPPVSASYMTTAALPAGPPKLMAPPLVPPMPPGSFLQKSSYVVDDHFTVDSFLYSLALEKYAINFKAEEVDMHALKQMGDSDLKDLGIPMGPRKKILLALQTRARRQI